MNLCVVSDHIFIEKSCFISSHGWSRLHHAKGKVSYSLYRPGLLHPGANVSLHDEFLLSVNTCLLHLAVSINPITSNSAVNQPLHSTFWYQPDLLYYTPVTINRYILHSDGNQHFVLHWWSIITFYTLVTINHYILYSKNNQSLHSILWWQSIITFYTLMKINHYILNSGDNQSLHSIL